MSMKPEALMATVERCGGPCDKGENSDFGMAAEILFPIAAARFYMVREIPVNRGIVGGMYVSLDRKVF